jgi:hypothetical protein
VSDDGVAISIGTLIHRYCHAAAITCAACAESADS